MTTTTTHDATASFTDLGVDADLADVLADVGITTPFPIQEITLPLALSGADVIGQARTGTGKTLAFGLPLLQRIEPDRRRFRRKGPAVQGLVIVPTRELCLQVRDDLAQASARRGLEVVAAYGGRSIEPQIEALRAGAPVVVGTPGRLLDLCQRGALDLSSVGTLVLDEADEMLDLGFLPDVERLIEKTPAQRQTLLFSATMPAPVVGLARRYMRKPTFLRADVEEQRIAPETRQHFFSCHRLDKPAVLARILQAPSRGLCVVFVRTKRMADILANELRDRGIAAAPIHSDLRQDARERALTRFRQGKIDVLVATEVAARGLDIDDVTHVVNYDCPDDEKMYLHRIGRTGRAGAAGVAVTLAVWNELARLEMIKRALDIEDETHEVFSTSEILDELFDLPPREPDRAEPSAADWQRAVARGRKGSQGHAAAGRGRGTDLRIAAESGGTRQADSDEADEVAAGTDAPPEHARRRTRRRSTAGSARGSRSEAAGAERGTPTRAEATGAAADTQDAAASTRAEGTAEQARSSAAEGDGRRRVRRRTRSTSSARSGDGGGRSADRRSRDGGRTERGARPGAGERATSSQDDGSRRRDDGARSSGGSGRGGSSRSGDGGGRDGRSSRQRDGGRKGRSGAGRRGSGKSPRGGRSERDGERSAERAAANSTVDRAEARGEGTPRLRRPLEVTHLP